MNTTRSEMSQHQAAEVVLDVDRLAKHFSVGGGLLDRSRRGVIKAVDEVSFALHKGETLGLVGESGCGKSTVARTLLRLEEPTRGTALFRGEDIFSADAKRLAQIRSRIQIIFQDPYASLNPRWRIDRIISEPWLIHKGTMPRAQWKDNVADLLESVGLRADHATRYPHEFSGGQRQRIGIARAIALQPEIIVCDEPVSALDVSVQAQVVNLLGAISAQTGHRLHFHRARFIGG